MNDKSPPTVNLRSFFLTVVAILLIAGGVAWQFGLIATARLAPNSNSLMVIAPYSYQGT